VSWWQWVLTAAAAIVVLSAAGTSVIKIFTWFNRTVGKLNEFLDDWHGEIARPGFSERPGIPLRLKSIESQLSGVDGRLGDVERRLISVEFQLKANGGTSLRDAVDRIETVTSPEVLNGSD